MFHYVYRITNGRQYYIGARSSRSAPEFDRYKGSGNWCIYTVPFLPRRKEIVSVHTTRLEAEERETELLREHVGNIHCMNRRVSSPKRKFRVQ